MEDVGLFLLGFVVGTFGTMIGAGGGFILMPILLLLYPSRSAEVLTALSLAVVMFNASSGSYSYGRMGRIDYTSGLLFLMVGIPGAVLGAATVKFIPRTVFNMVFGVVLLAVALFIFIRPTQRSDPGSPIKGKTRRMLTERNGTRHEFAFSLPLGMTLSFFVGFASSLLGIGGGIIHVPAMVHLLDFPVHVATATSHFILAGMALAGTIVHLADGSLRGELVELSALAAGAILGAQLGAVLSNLFHGRWIMRALAVALGLVGARILALSLFAWF